MSELRDTCLEHHDADFRVAVCRMYTPQSSRILSTLRSPTACVSCHLSLQAMRGASESAVVDMSDDARATAFVDHLARCDGDASVHFAHSRLVSAFAVIVSEVRGALGVGVEVPTAPTMLAQLPSGNDNLRADLSVLH
jgi:hypothetical protein